MPYTNDLPKAGQRAAPAALAETITFGTLKAMRRDVFLLAFALFFVALIGAAFTFSLRDYLTGRAAVGPGQVLPTAVPVAALPTQTPAAQPVSALNSAPETAVSTPSTNSPADQPTALSAPASAAHTVQAGETLFRIAANYGVALDDLAAANGITDPSLLAVGQILTIPNQAAAAGEGGTGDETAVPTPPAAPPISLNGVSLSAIVILPPNMLDNARAIYANGQQLGRNPHAFAKIGDSTVAIDHFLSRFDSGPYNLGDYAYLQRVIDYFPGSFARDSAAVRIGLHSWTVFDPIWADKSICGPNETVIACEFRLHNPSIVLIRLGANDVGAPGLYDGNMRQIVQFSIDNGVIPVLGTKADRNEGSNQNNDILRQIAADYQVPLWEFDPVAATMPGRGLDVDGVHMTTFYAHDYTQPEAFQRGHALNNLTALMMLDALLTGVILPAAP